MGGCPRPCAKVFQGCASFGKVYEKETKVEMLLPNYTQWSGMSCGDNWTMMRHGREKGGVFGEINKMVILREKRFF